MSDPVAPAELRLAIAEALANHCKSYELEDVCTVVGIPRASNEPEPFNSKRTYVRVRLAGVGGAPLRDVAQRIVAEYGDERLNSVLVRTGAHGVAGELKNLIFAANGPKPRIILRDAINNVIEIVQNAEFCLVYDRPLDHTGLTWGELVAWWIALDGREASPTTEDAHALYRRLAQSVGSPPERLLFDAYCARYGAPDGAQRPALVPQVYLHYDPYTVKELGRKSGVELKRQRMDFLLLLRDRARVVIEVDGKQHYADGASADPTRYAEMVSEDRRLRLAGYEVYRFGAAELQSANAKRLVTQFFDNLLARHTSSG